MFLVYMSLVYMFYSAILILCLFEVSPPGERLGLASPVCNHEPVLKEPSSIGRLMSPAPSPCSDSCWLWGCKLEQA